MSLLPAKQAFLDTRTSLLAQRLLKRAQREALYLAAPDEVEPLLELAGLQTLVEDPPSTPMELEQRLATRLVEEGCLLMHAMQSEERRFIQHWLRRLELINLKHILRAKFSGEENERILSSLLNLEPLSTLDPEPLVNSDSVEEFLRRLESTSYSAMARQARKVYEEHLELFNAEAVLDTHYFVQLVKLARALPDTESARIMELLGASLDQVNLVSLMRFRLNYDLDAPHAYFLLAPGGRRLQRPLLQQLARQETMEQMIALLPPLLRSAVGDADGIQEVESRMVGLVQTRARKVLRNAGLPMARAFAYLYLREHQIRFIHTVLKGHLLGLEPELIRYCADPLANRAEGGNPGVQKG